jgi:ATP-dependent helicase Lhr and Lhr-like helicase
MVPLLEEMAQASNCQQSNSSLRIRDIEFYPRNTLFPYVTDLSPSPSEKLLRASGFHPAVVSWFAGAFAFPAKPQAEAWPAIKAEHNVLIAAPTGSGKTLAAFLAAIDGLVQRAVAGSLKDETQIVYVSPLKALSNDIQRNLEAPLAGIGDALMRLGLPDAGIRTFVRTGDTPQSERDRMRRKPPHIVVTTPESLYILLGSESGRAMLKTTRTVIVDEIHALASNKRGAHLALSLERLDALTGKRLLRIGLSATQKPIETVANFLVGAGGKASSPSCTIINTGHRRVRDLALEVPSSPLEAVMSAEVWEQVYNRLAELIEAHRTTLIFVNTRRMAERVTKHLSERVGQDKVSAHHGSLAKEHRLESERRLQTGALRAMVATASLELGIDIGDVDLVCQLGSPRSISAFLQRVGRSGHTVRGTPKGRLFPLSRDDLVESAALIGSVNRGELDRLVVPERPLDVLSQQIVAEVAAQDWQEDELFALIRRAWPYRSLAHDDFSAVVGVLAEGITSRRGRRGALIHYDAVNRTLKGRRGARLTALTSGGAIPDTSDYQVLLEPESQIIGTVNEDFAVESMAGDIFQLGNTSYRILRVERGTVRVEDAHGMPPTIPFWLGEAPGRSNELSQAVSRFRQELEVHLDGDGSGEEALRWLIGNEGVVEPAARQVVEYLSAAHGALTRLPTLETIIFERFFDEAGGMQLVIHSPYGSRINRAWGLALRKRFCRKFNFELQAAATEDNIVLSLTAAHSFDLADVARYLNPATVRPLLIQALLDAPMFITRWRWVAGISLALPRFRGGRKVPPQLARMGAEDLIAAVFPDQIACAENLVGEREVPDHPLVNQTIADCLTDAMDIDGLERLLTGIESGSIQIIARDLTGPSPLAAEVLAARPYAYLDDAPLEERRTQAVMARRWQDPKTASDLGQLDAAAVSRVQAETWPEPASADELHDALVWLGFLTCEEIEKSPGWCEWADTLSLSRRVARFKTGNISLWVPAERLPQFLAIWPQASLDPSITAPQPFSRRNWPAEEALIEILRGRLEGAGPITEMQLAELLGLPLSGVVAALAALQVEGFALRGRFTPGSVEDEWCERGLLARIHRYTTNRLRAEIEPVPARDFLRFLFDWQHVAGDTRMEGPDAIPAIVEQLEGFEAAAGAWESEILPARLAGYEPEWLDDHCLAGRISWARLRPRRSSPADGERRASPVRSTPITLLARRNAALWSSVSQPSNLRPFTPNGVRVADYIRENGASFFEELVEGTRLLKTQVEEALGELTALGIVTSDSFGGLRALLVPADRRQAISGKRRRRASSFGMESAGRWALAPRSRSSAQLPLGGISTGSREGPDTVEHIARTLLRRYGVVFWRLLEREADWLPPWRDLLHVYRRLEARGEIRGGRFVAGFSGEQFALPEAVGHLREMRRRQDSEMLLSVCGADPLNLCGILTPGPRLPALTGNRAVFRAGLPVALLWGGKEQYLERLDESGSWAVRKVLLKSPAPARVAELA